MTLLTIINDVQKRLGIVVSATVMNDSSPAVKQLVAMAQVEGKDLAQRHPWSALQTRKAWTAVATEDQGALSTVASDMSIKHIRYMTAWNSTTKQQINGPLTGSQWAELKGRGMTPTWPAWRIYGSHFYIIPAPTVADAVQFEYVSKNWCQSSGGTGQTAWAADTDTGILDEDIMQLGIIWRYRADLGFDYAEAYADYERRVNALMNADAGKPPIYLSGPSGGDGIFTSNYITRVF